MKQRNDRVKGQDGPPPHWDLLSVAMADTALATGEIIVDHAWLVVAVPDVVMLIGVAHGEDLGEPSMLQRDDGRSVAFYRLPIGWDAPR